MTLALFLDVFITVETEQFSVPAIDIAQQLFTWSPFLVFSPQVGFSGSVV